VAESNRDILLDPHSGTREELTSFPQTRLSSVVADASQVVAELLAGAGDDQADALLVLSTVGAVGAVGLARHDRQLVSDAISSMVEIWGLGDPRAMRPNRTPDREATLWENLAINLYALGALAVEEERWPELRELTLQQAGDRDSWLRAGQVAASRSGDLDEDILTLAARRVRTLAPGTSEEEALAAVCQFDLLSALIISETAPEGFSPNAAKFGEATVESLVVDRLRHAESALRQSVFPNDDIGLREALRLYDDKARLQAAFARYTGADWRWRAFEDARTWAFIAAGHLHEKWQVSGFSR